MWQNSANVEAKIFTQHHRYAGRVATRGSRLADFLNDPGTDMVEMHKVHVDQPTNGQSGELECSQLLFKKESIVLAIPTGSYEAPARRIYSYVQKQQYNIHVMVPGYSLVGTAHLPARANSMLLMSEGTTTPSFIAITNVTVRFAVGSVEPIQSRVVIFRRQFIESIHLSEGTEVPQSLFDATAELLAMDASELVEQFSEVMPEEYHPDPGGLRLLCLDEATPAPERA